MHNAAMTAPSWTGVVRGINLAPAHAVPTEAVAAVEAVAGVGLTGDRHAAPGAPPGDQVTLIEQEAVEAANRDYGLTLSPADTRRNIVTAGVPLNHLVGREFSVGAVRLRGVALCEPCGRLQELTRQKVVRALRHRGGLNAEILAGGVIRVGDAVRLA
jgi:MOSC domain-containing protein YiiM